MLSMVPVVLALSAAFPTAVAQPTPPAALQDAAPGPSAATICHFQTGPLAGQVRDYSGVTGAKPFAAGAPCTDGKDSVGIADRAGPSASAERAGADAAATSYRCRFTAGPRNGQTAELPAPRDARPRPGAACADGQGSRGIVR
ncbi:MAG TPA: hypothetical protein VGN89_14905 [Phenylobacterium sp.]|nr:hypothetical protein [Phenylobacterium sp.]